MCLVLGTLLIIGSLVLFLRNRWEEKQAEEASAKLMAQMVLEIDIPEVEATAPLIPDIPRQLMTEADLTMKEMVIDGNAYIGYLSIPGLQLDLPIMSDWSYEKLQVAPCRYYGSLRGDDLVLMAHNYAQHFGKISQLKEGDMAYFTDVDGLITEYTVVGQDILDPDAVEEMVSGDFDLTLFTCTYGGESRVTVYCEKVTQ